MGARQQLLPRATAAGYADDQPAAGIGSFLEISHRVTDLRYSARVADTKPRHQELNHVRMRPAARHFVTCHDSVNHCPETPTETRQEHIGHGPVEAGVQSDLDALAAKGCEGSRGTWHFVDCGGSRVVIAHPQDEVFVNGVYFSVGGRKTRGGKKAADGLRLW
jgi:hypothetical protein